MHLSQLGSYRYLPLPTTADLTRIKIRNGIWKAVRLADDGLQCSTHNIYLGNKEISETFAHCNLMFVSTDLDAFCSNVENELLHVAEQQQSYLVSCNISL